MLQKLSIFLADARHFVLILFEGQLARQLYGNMRRQAAALGIQTFLRMHLARRAYKELLSSTITIQSGLRGMAAREELQFRRQTKAAIIIQVH